jgi:carboxyl-terminal processing protease
MIRKAVLLLVLVVLGHEVLSFAPDSTRLRPKAVFGKEARVVTALLENNHFRKIKFNDSLSSVILDNYFMEWDQSKLYFLKSDLEAFENLRYKLDDLSKMENVEPAFLVFAVFEQRYRTRLNYVLTHLVGREFDYTTNEDFETDRDKATWAVSPKELDESWRLVVKSQALSLKLTGKTPVEITDLLRKRYERLLKSLDQLNSEDVFGTYLNCITEAYDPHTNYLSPRISDIFNQGMRLSLEGIGARLTTENDYTKVSEIVPGGPADKAKTLHPNDLITAVAQGKDGEMVDVVGWRLDEVVKLIKGPKGTEVRLQILPAQTGLSGPPVIVSYTREKVKLEDQAAKKQVITYTLGGKNMKLGVITLPGFYMDFDAYQKGDPNYRSTTRDVKKLINELKSEGIGGLVMDLRNNGGGSLPEAIELTGLFIKEGPVVQVRTATNYIETMPDDDPSVVYDGPLVVLTNLSSASASEIFAGAIQDYRRGVIVGESTYGKGTVQAIYNLERWIPNQEKVGQLNLTFQKFYRVTGSSTQHKGVTPDILLPSAFSAERFGESSRPNALPWDVIPKTNYQPAGNINDKLLATLNRDYQERLKHDAALKKYVGDVEEMRKNLSETKISLNEAVRRKEMAESKAKSTETPADTRVTKEGIPTKDLNGLKDEPLREGLLILSDLLTKRIG